MSYKVQFLGVICFLRQNGACLAMLADGRRLTPRHTPRIVVDPLSVISEAGWDRNTNDIERGRFILPKGTVTLEGADQPGTLTTTDHESRLPKLAKLVPTFEIDPEQARTVATIAIRKGTLEAFVFPGMGGVETASLISELDVPHNGTITVTVTPKDGEVRTIKLKAGTEIAVVNDSMSRRRAMPHFHIYDQLNTAKPPRKSVGNFPPRVPRDIEIPVSQSQHPVFSGTVDGNDSCPNTGCCP